MEQTLHIKLTKAPLFLVISLLNKTRGSFFCIFFLSSCPLQVLKEITVRVGVIIARGKKFSALKFHLHREKIRLPQLQRALAGRS